MFKHTLLCAALCAAPLSHAQSAQSAQTSQTLSPVLVTGNPLRNAQADAWALRLSGDALDARRADSLGATLDGLPGVAASAFGPQASRPILRGLDGDRLRVLNNGGTAFDAAALSPDHALALDPLVVEAVEILRGPAALLYGGQALGGVVNSLDNRVPKGRSQGAALEARVGGATEERGAALVLDAAAKRGWAWHADLAARRAEDQRSPSFLTPEGGLSRRVSNSAGEQRGAALGGSWVQEQGFAGLALEDFRHNYGITAAPGVQIRLERQRLAHEGEWRWDTGWLRGARWQGARTRYAHDELEPDGAVGTRFDLRGDDARVELEHAPLFGGLRGVIGAQWERQAFSAQGEEAFVPSTRSEQAAVFLFEQWQAGDWTWAAGARRERVRQHSAGDPAGAEEPRFGDAVARRFAPTSLALQLRWQPRPAWALQAQASQAERAPTHNELFANGLHLATASFERGDPGLPLERARGVELALVHEHAGRRLQLNVYRQRFPSYLALQATGERLPGGGHGEDDEEHEGDEHEEELLPVLAYRALPARLWGWELQAAQTLDWAGWAFRLQASLDQVRGVDLLSGSPLPRLAPRRARFELQARQGAWTLNLGLRQLAAQRRVADDDLPTPGYRWWDLSLGRRFSLGGLDAQWTLAGQNLGNVLAYNASTLASLRALAPLPARNWQLRVSLLF